MMDAQVLSDAQLAGLAKVLYPESSTGNARLAALWNQILIKISKRQNEQRAQRATLYRARTEYLKKALLLQELEHVCRTGSVMDVDLRELSQRMQVADAIQRLELPVATISIDGSSKKGKSQLGSAQHWLGVTPKDLIHTCNMSSASTQALVDRCASVQQLILGASWHRLTTNTLTAHLSPRSSNNSATQAHHTEAAHTTVKGAALLSEPLSNLSKVEQTLDTAICLRQATLTTRNVTILLGLHQQLQLCMQLVHDLAQLTQRFQEFCDREVSGRQQELSRFFADLAMEHARSLYHKETLTEQQLLNMTYDAHTCKALLKIQAELKSRAANIEAQLQEARTLLSVYEALGPGFQELVAAYNRVYQELDSAKQTLKTFTDLESELQHRRAVC